MKALIVVDVQNDFVPGGALAVPCGDEVVEVANRLMPAFDLVVATQDWHPANHLSFASQHEDKSVGDVVQLDGLQQILWPDHCVQESFGAEFVSGLNVDAIQQVFRKGTQRSVDSYSGFFDNARRAATGLSDYLDAQSVREVYLVGLATDYCVLFTALDSVDLGRTTCLVLDGCRGVELATGDVHRALETMRSKGVNITTSEEVLAGRSS